MEPNTMRDQEEPFQAPVNTNNLENTTPVEPVVTPVESRVDNKKHNGRKTIAMVLLVLFAVVGLGFGVWSVVDRSVTINNLNTQIVELQKQNTDLIRQTEELVAMEENYPEAKEWTSTEVQDGVFYVVGENGEAIVHSDPNEVVVNEVTGCESSSGDTILTCMVQTSKGEGWFLYDVYGDSLVSSFVEE